MKNIGVSSYPEIKHSDEKRICAEIRKIFARCTPHDNRYLKAAMAVAWQSDVLVAIWDHMGETHSPTARVVDKFTRVLNRVVYSIDISSS